MKTQPFGDVSDGLPHFNSFRSFEALEQNEKSPIPPTCELADASGDFQQTPKLSICHEENRLVIEQVNGQQSGEQKLDVLPPGASLAKPPRRTGEKKESSKCNCKKTKCLRLYCDCFSKGRVCTEDCNCQNCDNLEEKSEIRSKIMKATRERNPLAFRPKIKSYENSNAKLHSRGCICKKTECIRNYCECFKAGLACTRLCKCRDCKNEKLELADYEVRLYYEKNCRKRNLNPAGDLPKSVQ